MLSNITFFFFFFVVKKLDLSWKLRFHWHLMVNYYNSTQIRINTLGEWLYLLRKVPTFSSAYIFILETLLYKFNIATETSPVI